MTSLLPSFSVPPVIETAIGVEFAPLQGFGIPHFGMYWDTIRAEYPTFETHGSIGSSPEQFGAAKFRSSAPKFELVTVPDVRCWFIRQTGDRLLQVQRDRFIHNWRKKEPESQYPRYASLKPQFEAEWQRFLAFLSSIGLETPNVTQCEVTYVNNLEIGIGWRSMAEIGRVFTFLSEDLDLPFVGAPETLLFNCNFVIPPEQGRLRVSAQHAIRVSDGTEIIQFTLTARGTPKSSSWSDISNWLDVGHEWIVRGFANLTRSQMHQVWDRRS